MKSASTPPSAALVADAISRIEERRDALDRLAAKGMEMLERIVAGQKVEIAGRKPFADPSRAFAVITRAVRLCLALATRLDEELIALLRGGPIPDLAILAPDAPAATLSPRIRIARAVEAAIDAEVGEPQAAERMRDHVREHLIERETYDAYLHQPWEVVVGKIRADLGLDFCNPPPQGGGGGPPKSLPRTRSGVVEEAAAAELYEVASRPLLSTPPPRHPQPPPPRDPPPL